MPYEEVVLRCRIFDIRNSLSMFLAIVKFALAFHLNFFDEAMLIVS